MKKSKQGVSIDITTPYLPIYPPIVIFKSSVDNVSNYLDSICGEDVKRYKFEGSSSFYIKDYQSVMSILDVIKMLNEKLYMDNGGKKQRFTHDKMRMKIEAAYAKYLSHHAKFHSSN